ncbi:MAG: hypothetical protein A2W22_06670 [Candidatus Levybacteria bacterium RBG_16_35_11]|nr:MAG: hypothetical protein A2W22_06670 [Candidatus Levybacteria bacterium RBG_16_35_11]
MKDRDHRPQGVDQQVAEKLNEARFELAKEKFLAELNSYPEKEESQDQLYQRLHGITTTDIVYAALNFLSLYGVKKSFKKIEETMEKVIKEKSREGDQNYGFGWEIFYGGTDGNMETMSSWDMAWGFMGVYGGSKDISITEEEKRSLVFTSTRLWNKRLKKEMSYHLPKFKTPRSAERLEDVFAVSRDLIQAL